MLLLVIKKIEVIVIVLLFLPLRGTMEADYVFEGMA